MKTHIAYACTLLRLLKSAVFILGILSVNSCLASDHENARAVNNLLGTLNSKAYNHSNNGGMLTAYKYTFSNCHIVVHSEFYGLEHSEIDDDTIPITMVDLSKEIDKNRGEYYLFMKCKNGKNCIRVKGESTGDPHDYMFSQNLIYAGRNEQSYNKVRKMFEEVISGCNKPK